MFRYEFAGGVYKPDFHDSVKFLLFFVVGGEEIPHYQMVNNGQVLPATADRLGEMDFYARMHRPDYPVFTTQHNSVKVFIRTSGVSLPNRFYSFYFQMVKKGAPMVTIRPFPGCHAEHYLFRAQGNFLTKNQALELLSDDCPSRIYLKRQEMPSREVLRSMITIDRSIEREGIRHLRIGQRRKGGEG